MQEQLAAESPANPGPRELIDRLEALTATSLLMSSRLAARPSGAAPFRLSALTARIAQIKRLLAELIRTAPSSARRLAPTLLALHALLKSLLAHRVSRPSLVGPSAGAAALVPDAVQLRLARPGAPLGSGVAPRPADCRVLLACVDAAAAPERPGVAAERTAGHAHPQADGSAGRRRGGRVAIAPVPAPFSTGGSPSTASGAGSTGAPGGAAAPVTVLVALRVGAMLSGRLTCGELPCRSTIVEWRLERPG